MSAVTVARSIGEVSPAEWDALDAGGVPFLAHAFLAALEATGCVGGETGWLPRPLLLRERPGGRLLGAVPLYEKSHSWGEFVFDFSWAQAYARYGDRYYPKLIAATPFTPATGPRLLVAPGADAAAVSRVLVGALEALCTGSGYSGVHVHFPTDAQAELLERAGWHPRIDCQFHWTNRGYADFEAFLATFTAEKRKKARRERRRVEEAGIRFEIRDGEDLDPAAWRRVYALHASTFHRHGHEPYLSAGFFRELTRTLPGALKVVLAILSGEIVATAILFRGRDALYGRYWGAAGDYHSLHFETCYYQGIDYAIREGLARFEPGTQGEHKIARGFSPSLTHSCHYIADPAYARAIATFLAEERAGVRAYVEATADHVPYRREERALTLPGRP